MQYLSDFSGYGNKILYKMCKDEILHQDIDVVKSKLWIIGRSYSASIERGAGEGFNIETTANAMINSELDKYLKELDRYTRIEKDNLNLVLQTHKLLVDIFEKTTTKKKRSLASKYLHFHNPKMFFIYDSFANKYIREKLYRRRYKYTRKYDLEYEEFCLRCLDYRQVLEKKLKGLVSARRLDMDLLYKEYGKDYI